MPAWKWRYLEFTIRYTEVRSMTLMTLIREMPMALPLAAMSGNEMALVVSRTGSRGLENSEAVITGLGNHNW